MTMSDVTRILNAIERGDTQAADKLLPLVYEQLRLLAGQKLFTATTRSNSSGNCSGPRSLYPLGGG